MAAEENKTNRVDEATLKSMVNEEEKVNQWKTPEQGNEAVKDLF